MLSGPKLISIFVFSGARARRVKLDGCGDVSCSLMEARIYIMTVTDSLLMGGAETSVHPLEADFRLKLLYFSLKGDNF